MVELELEDYSEIFDWFTLCFGKKKNLKLSSQAKNTFWKLKFLTDDKIKEHDIDDDESV